MQQFQVRKDNFSTARLVSGLPTPEMGEGEVLLRLDQFAFTANNITYAAAGDMLGYWQFFAPQGDAAEGWGVIPVWGIADVIESNVSDVPVGERLYGYFPPATYVTMQPVHIGKERLVEGVAHRQALPSAYNSYVRLNNEPGYSRDTDASRMLLAPLFITSFCLWDKLKAADWYGAEQVAIISASSKTGIGLGYGLADDKDAPSAIALTSARNVEAVQSLGIYDETVAYDAIASMDASRVTAVVDMSGNADVLAALQQHFGDNLKHIVNVGFTHWDAPKNSDEAVAAKSEMFFAPTHLQQRINDWGPQEFGKRSTHFMMDKAAKSLAWLDVRPQNGLQGLAAIYDDVCGGKLPPSQGVVVGM